MTETAHETQVELEVGYASGKSVPRKEDGRLVQGQGVFADDIKRHGMGYVHFVRAPYARIAFGTCSLIEPRCTGCANPCATDRSSASKNAHEKSERVLMFVEYALRLSASAISSVAATSAFRITSNVTGSTVPAPAPAKPAPPLLGGSVEPTPPAIGTPPWRARR